MSEHTPGPWSADWGDAGNESAVPYCSVYSERDKFVADCGSPSCDRAKANARLIAAAPELLEALEDAVGDLEAIMEVNADDFYDLTSYKAAIAKARGQ